MSDCRLKSEYPLIPISRPGRGIAAGDLGPAVMRFSQRGGKGDAGTGNLCAGAGCANRSGALTVIVAPAPPLPPPVVDATAAVSPFAPLSIAIVWPALKPVALATAMTVALTLMAVLTVVAPAVPTVAITAVSRFAPVSIKSV